MILRCLRGISLGWVSLGGRYLSSEQSSDAFPILELVKATNSPLL